MGGPKYPARQADRTWQPPRVETANPRPCTTNRGHRVMITRYVYWYARPVHLDPEISPTFTTPNQPAYPSGHSCIEGATSQVLAYLFPREAIAFQTCAEELAKSRWWAGIHFTWDNNDGLKLGRGVADKLIERAKANGGQ
jgi:hypothetical protein